MVLLLRSLGYDLAYTPTAEVVEGKTFAISHRAISQKRQATGCERWLNIRRKLNRITTTWARDRLGF